MVFELPTFSLTNKLTCRHIRQVELFICLKSRMVDKLCLTILNKFDLPLLKYKSTMAYAIVLSMFTNKKIKFEMLY